MWKPVCGKKSYTFCVGALFAFWPPLQKRNLPSRFERLTLQPTVQERQPEARNFLGGTTLPQSWRGAVRKTLAWLSRRAPLSVQAFRRTVRRQSAPHCRQDDARGVPLRGARRCFGRAAFSCIAQRYYQRSLRPRLCRQTLVRFQMQKIIFGIFFNKNVFSTNRFFLDSVL